MCDFGSDLFRTTKKVKKQVLASDMGNGNRRRLCTGQGTSNEKLWLYLPISGIFAIVSVVIIWSIFRQDFLTVMPIALNEIFHR